MSKFSNIHNPKAAADLLNSFKRRFATRECLAPTQDCEGSIVAAHTLSSASMLRPLSRNGEVYALHFDLFAKEKSPQLMLRGLNQVSIFNGFCAKHDDSIFAPIEKRSFVCSREQAFLYAFRAVSREMYLKRKQAESFPSPEKFAEIHGMEGAYELTPLAMNMIAGSIKGAEEVERLKASLNKVLLVQEFGRLTTNVIQFRGPLPIAAAFAYTPYYDFNENPIQEVEMERPLSHLMVTLLPGPPQAFLLLSYLDTAGSAPAAFVRSLLAQSDIPSALLGLIAYQCENYALSPDWFESLNSEDQSAFHDGLWRNADIARPEIAHPRNFPVRVTGWDIENVFTL